MFGIQGLYDDYDGTDVAADIDDTAWDDYEYNPNTKVETIDGELSFDGLINSTAVITDDDGVEHEIDCLKIGAFDDEEFIKEHQLAHKENKTAKSLDEAEKKLKGKTEIDMVRKDILEIVKKMPKVSEARRKKILEKEFDGVYVNDFGDYYHLSEEEQQKKIANFALFAKVRRQPSVCKNILKYIKAMRVCLECLDSVAKTQKSLWSADEFKIKFFRGEIYITGLVMPKYIGKDAKTLDWDYIAKFLLSDEPVENFLFDFDDTEPVYDVAAIIREELDQIEGIDDDWTDEEKEEQMRNKDALGVVTPVSKKEYKQLMAMPDMKYISKMKRKMSMEDDPYNYISMLDEHCSEIDKIVEADERDFADKVRAKYYSGKKLTKEEEIFVAGDIDDDDVYNKYMNDLREYSLDNTIVNHNGRPMTLREQTRYFNRIKMERDGGLNMKRLYQFNNQPNKEDSKELSKKAEKRTKSLISKMESAYKRNSGTIKLDKADIKALRKTCKQQLKDKCSKSRKKPSAEFSLSAMNVGDFIESKKKKNKKKKGKKKKNKARV